MNLTPEEKQKIYEEEKVRLEAQEKLKKNKQGMGCLVIVGIFVVLGILGSFGSEDLEKTSQGTQSEKGEAEAEMIKTETKEEVTPTPEVIILSGFGQKATQKFVLQQGLSIFKITHEGSSNFSIVLMDSDGERVELLVNEIGKFVGSKAVGIANGSEYILDISANGKWAVTIEQPRSISAPSKPVNLTGRGQQSSDFFTLDNGLSVFRMTHDGKSNFAVVLMDENGERYDLLVNEIGKFDGSKAVGISNSGSYLLDVSADGNWSITVE